MRHADFSPTGFVAKLKEAGPYQRPLQELVFAEELPEPHGGGFVIFNHAYGCRDVRIRNCRFHHFTRAILLMAKNVTIEGCEFRDGNAAGIKMETGYTVNAWSEGYGVENVVIRGTVFERVNRRGRYPNENRPDIYINGYMRSDPTLLKPAYPVIRDVLIRDNLFQESTGAPVFACTAARVTVCNNVFRNLAPCPLSEPWRGVVGASHARDVAVLNNGWQGSDLAPLGGLVYDPLSVSGAVCAGNAFWR